LFIAGHEAGRIDLALQKYVLLASSGAAFLVTPSSFEKIKA
jgi:hypothetical protein